MEVGQQWPGVIILMPSHYALLWLLCRGQWRGWGGESMSSGQELCLGGGSVIQVRTEWEAIYSSVSAVCVGGAGERGGVSLNLLAQNNLTQTLLSRLAGRTVLVQYLSANKREQGFDSYSYSISDINRITFHSITWLGCMEELHILT